MENIKANYEKNILVGKDNWMRVFQAMGNFQGVVFFFRKLPKREEGKNWFS